MSKEELAKQIYAISNIKGQFKLRSGVTSNEYFDKYLFESNPNILKVVADELSMIIPKEIDYLAGLEMGGIPIATALSLKTGIPTVFVRKKAKEYGTCKLAEGGDVNDKTLLIVEDVVTTGGAIIDAVNALRELGANVTEVFCVIDRESDAKTNLEKNKIKLTSIFTKSTLFKAANK